MVVENNVNALAVLAIHQIRYTESDLVVVGVFDEGADGGLVLTVRALPAGAPDAELPGAKAAAACVLESFIEHALRLDGCTTALRRLARVPAALGAEFLPETS